MYASTYVLVALSIDRCDAITNPMNFSRSCKYLLPNTHTNKLAGWCIDVITFASGITRSSKESVNRDQSYTYQPTYPWLTEKIWITNSANQYSFSLWRMNNYTFVIHTWWSLIPTKYKKCIRKTIVFDKTRDQFVNRVRENLGQFVNTDCWFVKRTVGVSAIIQFLTNTPKSYLRYISIPNHVVEIPDRHRMAFIPNTRWTKPCIWMAF